IETCDAAGHDGWPGLWRKHLPLAPRVLWSARYHSAGRSFCRPAARATRRAAPLLRGLQCTRRADAADHQAGAAVGLAGELLVHRIALAETHEPAHPVSAVDEGTVHRVDAEGDHVARLGRAGDR